MGNTTTKRNRVPRDQESVAIGQILKILNAFPDPVVQCRIVNYLGARVSAPQQESQNGEAIVGSI